MGGTFAEAHPGLRGTHRVRKRPAARDDHDATRPRLDGIEPCCNSAKIRSCRPA